MNCELAQSALHGYFDGELDAVRAAEFERHLETCAECRAALDQMESLRTRLQDSSLREHASPELRSRIRRELDLPAGRGVAVRSWRRPVWRAVFATAAAAAMLAIFFVVVPMKRDAARIEASLLDAEVRSLQTGHLIDVESTDKHTVKPWFEGKLDFVPPVEDFADRGFPLVGGRLDVVDGRNAAVLVYGRRKHFINLFVWRDAAGANAAAEGSARGYQWTMWRSHDMRFCLVSDVPADDLRQLKSLLGN